MTDILSTRQKAFATVGIMLTLLLVALDQTFKRRFISGLDGNDKGFICAGNTQ